jgi:hypothetical protein
MTFPPFWNFGSFSWLFVGNLYGFFQDREMTPVWLLLKGRLNDSCLPDEPLNQLLLFSIPSLMKKLGSRYGSIPDCVPRLGFLPFDRFEILQFLSESRSRGIHECSCCESLR